VLRKIVTTAAGGALSTSVVDDKLVFM